MRRHRLQRLTALTAIAALTWSASACGAAEPAEPSGVGKRDSGEKVRVVGRDKAALHLWVSNQSFRDDPVHITVSIDGSEVVDAPFAVEGQHNWVLFPLELAPGQHVLHAVSDTGVTIKRTIMLPERGRRYVVVDYWSYAGEPRKLTVYVSNEPVAFA